MVMAWTRVLGEQRRLLAVLAAGVVLNGVVYAFIVQPLSVRVANIQDRDKQAEQALALARGEDVAARGALTGKERAGEELATFYQKVLPADLAGARRITHLRLAQVAREAGLGFERFSFDPEPVKGSSLTRVKGELVLTGPYAKIRQFIHTVETAKDFIVLDELSLAEGAQASGTLVVTLKLSTYFRVPAP